MSLVNLRGDRNPEVFPDWDLWLKHTASIYEKCLNSKPEYRPFHDHEQAAVSLLVGAAHRAKLLAFAECGVAKGERKGRTDLWFACENRNYWFEFKRSAYNPSASKWGLQNAFKNAQKQVAELDYVRGEIGVVGIIAATNEMKAGYRDIYSGFASEVDYAFHLDPDGSRGAYLYFKLMER